jgi:hypothetical protein
LWAVGSQGFVGRTTSKGIWTKATQVKTGLTLRGVVVMKQPRWVVAVGDVGTIIRASY